MLNPAYSRTAVAGTICLITFLAYVSQIWLLYGQLQQRQVIIFNTLVACIWITYVRAIYTDPGTVPQKWEPPTTVPDDAVSIDRNGRIWSTAASKWCKKCSNWKPQRAHHCKTCQRCTLLMDHHCPWINNCVGYRNWPHFMRFLFYTVSSCSYLEYFLFVQCYNIFLTRDQPAYEGPTISQLVLLIMLLGVNSFTLLGLFILFLRTLSNTVEGYTTIETWEQERHNSLVRRRTVSRQIYPYDVSFYTNICVVMAGGLLTWFWPFTRNRVVGDRVADGGGLRYRVNGFEKPSLIWPPPDPESVGLKERIQREREAGVGPWANGVDGVGDVTAFKKRQQEDLQRRNKTLGNGGRYRDAASIEIDYEEEHEERNLDASEAGEDDEEEIPVFTSDLTQNRTAPKWRNEDGDTLADYGVDEEADEDEDDVPLAVLIQRRRNEQVGTGLNPTSS